MTSEMSRALRTSSAVQPSTSRSLITAACVAYIAAHAARELGGPEAEARERAWQARWLADRLGISRRA